MKFSATVGKKMHKTICPICRRYLPDFHRRPPPATCPSHSPAASFRSLPPANIPLSVVPPAGAPTSVANHRPCHGRGEPGGARVHATRRRWVGARVGRLPYLDGVHPCRGRGAPAPLPLGIKLVVESMKKI